MQPLYMKRNKISYFLNQILFKFSFYLVINLRNSIVDVNFRRLSNLPIGRICHFLASHDYSKKEIFWFYGENVLI